MGRLAVVRRPPASGAVIFYGRPTASNATPISTTNPSPHSHLETSSSARSLFSIDSDTSSSTIVDEKEITSDEIIKIQHTGSHSHIDVFSSQIIQESNPDHRLDKGNNSTSPLILQLVKDVLQIFQEVPYVKTVAGLVQQILTISNVRFSPITQYYMF